MVSENILVAVSILNNKDVTFESLVIAAFQKASPEQFGVLATSFPYLWAEYVEAVTFKDEEGEHGRDGES